MEAFLVTELDTNPDKDFVKYMTSLGVMVTSPARQGGPRIFLIVPSRASTFENGVKFNEYFQTNRSKYRIEALVEATDGPSA